MSRTAGVDPIGPEEAGTVAEATARRICRLLGDTQYNHAPIVAAEILTIIKLAYSGGFIDAGAVEKNLIEQEPPERRNHVASLLAARRRRRMQDVLALQGASGGPDDVA